MTSFAVGPDAGLVEGNAHTALVADFPDAAAFRAYAGDRPDHGGLREDLPAPTLRRLAGPVPGPTLSLRRVGRTGSFHERGGRVVLPQTSYWTALRAARIGLTWSAMTCRCTGSSA